MSYSMKLSDRLMKIKTRLQIEQLRRLIRESRKSAKTVKKKQNKQRKVVSLWKYILVAIATYLISR